MKNGPYELIVPPNEYPGKRYRKRYAYEHHVVWWIHTGELLQEGEVIHHKNRKHRDNRFENLEKMTVKEHDFCHAKDRKPEIWILTCDNCGVEFERLARKQRHKNKGKCPNHWYNYIFCSVSCSTQHQWNSNNDRSTPV